MSERQSCVISGGEGWEPLHIASLAGPAAWSPDAAAVQAALADENEMRIAAAFQEGMAQGRHRASVEAQDRDAQLVLSAQQRWSSLLAGLAKGIEEIESGLADRLLELTTLLASTIACREMSATQNRIEPVLRELMKMITDTCRHMEVTAHPSDCDAIDTWLRPQCGDSTLSIRADPALAPGGCVLRADDTTLDATLQTRIRRTLASVGLGSTPIDAILSQTLATAGAAGGEPAAGPPRDGSTT